MFNVIYPMSLILPSRRKADQWRRHASLMHKSDTKWRFVVQVAETYDVLADNIMALDLVLTSGNRLSSPGLR
jgi:hypothetical protein